VSWAYYLDQGTDADCPNDQMICTQPAQKVKVPGIWNPLPDFDTVKQDGQLGNLLSDFDFSQTPRAPVVLSVHPQPGPASTP